MEGNEVVVAKVVYRNVLKIGRAANVNGSDEQAIEHEERFEKRNDNIS